MWSKLSESIVTESLTDIKTGKKLPKLSGIGRVLCSKTEMKKLKQTIEGNRNDL